MFTQFFGHFLLEKKILTSEQLLLALTEQTNARIKLGTLAIHAGLMTANEVERVIILQTKQDQRFGEIAVAKGYLTSDQVNDLIERQSPEYLVLGQILVEQNIITHAQFEQLLSEYQTENELFELDMLDEQMYVGFSESEKEQLCDYFDRIYENMERLKNAAMEGQNETV